MRFDRTTIIFVLFVLIIGAIFAVQQFVINQPPLNITVAVDPLAEKWAQAVAADFNSTNPVVLGTTPVKISILVMDDLDVWRGNPGWNSTNHPQGWLASSSLSVAYAPGSLPFEVVANSTARTPLVWGGFNNRVDVITANATRPFDWTAVQEIADGQRWEAGGNVNMAIVWVSSSMSGTGALFTAIAEQSGQTTITRALIDDPAFDSWFAPIHDSIRNAERIGGSPAEAMAARGTTVADFALLPESLWLNALNDLKDDGFVFAYPAYTFMLDFPLARWNDATTPDAERAALDAFATHIQGNRGQELAVSHGLRPANNEPDANATLFVNGQSYGIELAPDFTQIVQPDNRNTTDAVIRIVE